MPSMSLKKVLPATRPRLIQAGPSATTNFSQPRVQPTLLRRATTHPGNKRWRGDQGETRLARTSLGTDKGKDGDEAKDEDTKKDEDRGRDKGKDRQRCRHRGRGRDRDADTETETETETATEREGRHLRRNDISEATLCKILEA